MNLTDVTTGQSRTAAAHLLGGAIGAGVVGATLSPIVPSLQQATYATLYAQFGPWRATEAAVLLAGAIVGLLSVAVPTVLVALVRGPRDSVPPILAGLGALFGVSVFLVVFVAPLGLLGSRAAMVALVIVVGLLGVGLYHLRTDPRTVATFGGGVPVFALLLVLLVATPGGGYAIVAEETRALDSGDVNGSVADFDSSPEVRDDLFSPANREDGDPATYRLSLREYDRGSSAARFLDANGVRCPYLGVDGDEESGTFVAVHDGTHYRVRCIATPE
ncbi:MAG: hypothetical protein ABEH88_01635 [Halobacteriales archaeon]